MTKHAPIGKTAHKLFKTGDLYSVGANSVKRAIRAGMANPIPKPHIILNPTNVKKPCAKLDRDANNRTKIIPITNDGFLPFLSLIYPEQRLPVANPMKIDDPRAPFSNEVRSQTSVSLVVRSPKTTISEPSQIMKRPIKQKTRILKLLRPICSIICSKVSFGKKRGVLQSGSLTESDETFNIFGFGNVYLICKIHAGKNRHLDKKIFYSEYKPNKLNMMKKKKKKLFSKNIFRRRRNYLIFSF